jgi:hypothetical protein
MTGAGSGALESRGGFPVHAGYRPAANRLLEQWRLSKRGGKTPRLPKNRDGVAQPRSIAGSVNGGDELQGLPLLFEKTESAATGTT